MNPDLNSPLVPPTIPGAAAALNLPSPLSGAAGAPSPDEKEPVTGVLGAVEAMLRQPRRVLYHLQSDRPGALTGVMLVITIALALVYGLVMGTFSGGTQLWAAPLKAAAGLILSALICLPSLYIFACLSGSTARLREVAGLLAGLLLMMTLLLSGFAPVAWVFSQSTQSVAAMGVLHLLFWLIATCFGLRFLNAGFAMSASRSRSGIWIWMAIFMLVMLQMTAALRPLVGTADTLLPQEKRFFLSHWIQCLEKPSPPNQQP
jgi:hypothetical protein